MRRVIALTTDFGLQDHYVGAMKGVIAGIAPEAELVDITHGIPPQDIVAGALALEAAFPYFPPGTIYLAVVDPGVGGDRRAVAVETARSMLVGPDNGLFSLVLLSEPMRRAVELANPAYRVHPVSATFHGRDIFAPAAAHLAAGVSLDAFGPSAERLVTLDLPEVAPMPGGARLCVLAADRFGNLVTNLTLAQAQQMAVGEGAVVEAGGSRAPVLRTFGDVSPGEPVAYFGSAGRLEVAVRNGSAAEVLGVGRGDRLTVRA